MASEQELKKTDSQQKEFQNLLDKDFKDRKLKENEIIKATVTEVSKNYVVCDLRAKQEAMIPIEEFKNDKELEKLKVGSQIDVFLERIESFKGEIIVSRDKARKMKAWKKMEKVFETQEEMTGYITGKVKGGFIATVEGLPCFMPSSQIDIRPLKKIDHLKSARKTIKIESKGLENLSKTLSSEFNEVCDSLLKTKGKIIVVHFVTS